MSSRHRILALAALISLLLLPGWPQAFAQDTGSVEVQRDVPYGTAAGLSLVLDVYSPAGGGTAPAIVLVHPGGFVGGDKSDPDISLVAQFYAERGYVVFNVNYRSARDGFAYPAQVEDVRQAVRFVRESAGRYGVDPGRVAAFGASAGGTLAASVGVEGQGSLVADHRVAAVVTWSAALDLVEVARRNENALEGLYTYVTGEPGQRANRQGNVTLEEIQPLLEAASPIKFVDPTDPPMFIANSPDEFMPLDQAKAMAARLEQAGVPHELFEPRRGHALAYTEEALEPTLEFLDRHLRGASPFPTETPTASSPTSPRPSDDGSAGSATPAVVGGIAGAVALIGAGYAVARWRRNAGYRA
jgi:acetyl esterase